MARKYIKELGDKKSHGVAATEGDRVKTIAPVYYMPSDSSPDSDVKVIQTELDKKEDKTNKTTGVRAASSASDTLYPTEKAVATALADKATKQVRLTFMLPVAPSGGTSVKYVKITGTGGDYRQWLCSYNGNSGILHSTWLFRSYATGESGRDSVTLIKNGTASERQWYCSAANTWYVKFTNTATTSSYQMVFNVMAIDTSALPTLEAVDTMPDTASEITVYGVTKAEQLRTACQLAVSLSNTGTTTTFDGSANVTNIKVSGTLGVGNGGTGKTTVTAGNYLVGNGSSALTEKTPAQVLSDIGAQAALSFDGTYNASSNKAATVSTVTNAIDALDVPASGTGAITGMGAGKTLASLTETNGKVAATFQDISITKSQVSDFSHTHGNIANGGTLTDTAAAAAGNDYVVIRDADNAKIQTSTIKGTDVADAVSKKHSHSTLTLSTTAQAYDGSHTLALPSTDPYTSARTPASHSHGNIQNGGTLQTTDVAIANGDKLVVTDASDSNKVARTSVSFDGSTTTKALTQKGTFESFAKSSDITSAVQALDVSSVGGDGKYISAISETDGKISATATTMDTTPTANSTNAVTSGGVKTELDNRIDRYDAVYNRNNTAGEGWVKLADTKPYSSITQVDKPAIWDVMITRCTGETSSEQLCLNVRYESTGLPNVYFKRFYTVDRTSTHKFAVVVSGVGGGSASEGKVELWAFLEKHWGSIAIREVAGSTSTTLYGMNKIQYNYYSYNLNGGTEKPVEDVENHIQVVDSTNVKMATDQDAAKKSDGVYYVVGYSYAAYSSSKTYTQTTSTGPFDDTNSCVYSSQPYYCTTTISTGEAWNSNHWAKIPTAVWTGTSSAITSLYAGLKIAIKVPSYGGSSATQININGLGAKTMLRNTSNYTSYLPTNSIVFLTYDGTYWRWADYNTDGQWYVCGYCSTAAATAAKVASANNYVLTAGNVILIRFTAANTSHTALTLNVNGQGAKPLYINGEASSTTNYTLPAGIWVCYYSGTYWDVRTDGSYRFKSLTLDNPLSIANGGTGATTASDARYNLDVYSKAEIDDDVVHKAGEEIITGRKIFRDSIGISYDDDGEIGYSTKVLGQLSRGASYNEWSAGDKDGHHYREWTIKVPYILGFGALRVKIASMGLLNALNGVSGTLEKTIVVSVGASQVYQNMGYYTIIDDGPATDFRISDLIINEASQSETKTEIKIRTMHPEYDYTALTVSVDAYGKFSHFEDIELGSENPDIVTGETYDTITGTSSDPTTVVTHQWSTVPKIQNSLGKDILVDGDIIQSSTNGNLSVRGSDVEVYAHPTQTAYTSKGTATKVPQITTDSTGHVTSISEVTISGVTPSSHASTATTYGIGTTSTYGHVKLATGDMNGATNTDGVAVSKNHTHSQYAPKASPALTGTPTAPTAADGTNTTQIATTAFVQSAVAQGLSVSDAMVYKGTITLGASSPGGLTVAADKGHTYKVIANGTTTSGYVDGVKVEAGDMVICNTDSTAAATSSNYSTIAAKWDFVQGNTDGVVVGPASATSGNVVLFDGATGKLIKDGGKLGTSAFKDVASSGNASTTQVVMGNDSRLTDSRTPTEHSHGNITNGGALQTNDVTIASGDKLVITDESNSNKVARASLSFDGSTTTKALTQKGTFESFAKSSDITTAIQALDVASVGGDGKYIKAISETDGKISATVETMDTTPTASSTKAVTSGGIKTALEGKANGTRWTAVTKGQTWSRLFYSVPSNSVEGSSGILAVSCTRGVVVCNATFLITASHSGASYSSIIELASCNYTQVRSRIVVNSNGNYYFEVYDTAQSIASSTTQRWHCTFLPLLGADLTTYTEFTNGTTIPSGYTATNDFTTTGGNAAAAIKNITRSGTTFTATRQDGSTFTFTQQDSNNDTKVVATAKTDNANYKILATASASPTSASATEAVYSPNIALNPSTNTISANITGYAYGLHNSNVIEHQGNKDTYPLHRIASYPDSLVTTQSPNADNSLILHLFSKGYSYSDYGIVMITVKIPSTVDNTHPPTINISWKLRSSGIPADAVQAVCIYSDGLWHVDVFFRIQHQYQLTVFNKLGSNGRWALYSSTDASGGTEIYSAYSGTENTAASTKLYNLPSYDSAANQRGDGSIVGTAITATTASNFDTSGGTIKSSLNAKVNIASDGVVATSNSHWDIIMQVATIASNGVHYKRWLCNSDGTSAFVDYRPNSDNAAFMLEAYAVKWNSYTDCKYKLLYWRSGKQTPYVAELIFNQAQGLFPETITWRDTGVADSAYKLTTARKTYVTLGTASTSTTRDWSGDTTIPVDGTLGVANGGTGKSTVAANNFLVGNLTGALVEKTPSEVRTLIGAGTSSLTIGTTSTQAAAGDHKHGTMHSSFTRTVPDQSSDTTWATNLGLENDGFWLKSLRMQHDAPNWLVNNFGAGIAFGGVDTKGVISLAYDNSAHVRFAGGNGQSPNWYWTLKGSSGKTYTLPSDTCSLQAAFSIKKNGATITPSDGVADIGYMPVTGTLSTSTVQGAIQALRVNPGGKMGSVQLSASTVDSTSIPAAWYNYIWIPHRTGAAEADNQNFGTLILTPMTSTPEVYVIEGSDLNTSSPTYRISSLQAALPTTGTASTTYAINVGGNAATATSATTATNYNTNSGTIKTKFESKLDIAPVGVSGPNDLLTLVKSLGANNIRYRRWICASSGGSDNISNRPNSDQSPFMLEAFATRWISASDYQYELIYYKTNTPYPYLATIMQSTTSISWVYSADARNATSINGYSLVVGPYVGEPNTIYLD